MAKFTTFNKHRPIDPSDPGFTLPGVKLRWISGRVQEVYAGRIWATLRKEDLPAELVKHIESMRPDAFQHGNTYRRYGTELILGYATEQAAKEHRQEINRNSERQMSTIKTSPISGTDSKGNQISKVESFETVDDTQNMINRFSKKEE